VHHPKSPIAEDDVDRKSHPDRVDLLARTEQERLTDGQPLPEESSDPPLDGGGPGNALGDHESPCRESETDRHLQ
jgi:hypothetical protein